MKQPPKIDLPSYVAGQWRTADQLCNWLNTLEDNKLDKALIYKWAMQYKPLHEFFNDD